MEKQHIIRGAAILCLAASATVFAAPHIFMASSSNETKVDLSVLQQRASVKSAGLAGASSSFETVPETAIIDEDVAKSLSLLHPEVENTAKAEIQIVSIASLRDSENSPASRSASDGSSARHASAHDDIAETECETSLNATATVDALIEVELFSPCHAESRFIISHDDLVVSAYLNEEGRFSTYLPALATRATIDVFLGDDTSGTAEIEVEDADQFLRVMLQWTGETQFGLHAYHDGADYGDSGHVHALQPFDPDLDEASLISLGEMRGPEPMLAQVYSLPLEMMDKTQLEVEAQFTEAQCGADLVAFISQSKGQGASEMTELSFAAPDCPGADGLMVMPIDIDANPVAQELQEDLQLTDRQE